MELFITLTFIFVVGFPRLHLAGLWAKMSVDGQKTFERAVKRAKKDKIEIKGNSVRKSRQRWVEQTLNIGTSILPYMKGTLFKKFWDVELLF